MNTTETHKPNVAGIINSDEANLLANTTDPENDPQVISIRERLGVTALNGEQVYAVVSEEDDSGNEIASHYVNLDRDDLGTKVREANYGSLGLKRPAEAAEDYYKQQRSKEIAASGNKPISRDEIKRVGTLFNQMLSSYSVVKQSGNSEESHDRFDGDTSMYVSSMLANAEASNSSKEFRSLVAYMAAGAIRNPNMAAGARDAANRAGSMTHEEARVLEQCFADAHRIAHSDAPDEDKFLSTHNMIAGTLQYLRPGQANLQKALLAYGSGALIENPQISSALMNDLNHLLSKSAAQ